MLRINSFAVILGYFLFLKISVVANDQDRLIQSILKAEERYRVCEYGYFLSSVPSDPEQESTLRLGGHAGFESFQDTVEFLLASNRYSSGEYSLSKLQNESMLEPTDYGLLFIGNAKYKAMLRKLDNSKYELADLASPAEGSFSLSDGRRVTFAPLIGLELDKKNTLINFDERLDGIGVVSMTIKSKSDELWKNHTMYFDSKTFACLGQDLSFFTDDKLTSNHSKSVIRIEYDPVTYLPAKYVETITGKFNFVSTCVFTKMSFGNSNTERYFLKHYGIDELPSNGTMPSLGPVFLVVGLIFVILGIIVRVLRSPQRV